jgi:hypothetical protein
MSHRPWGDGPKNISELFAFVYIAPLIGQTISTIPSFLYFHNFPVNPSKLDVQKLLVIIVQLVVLELANVRSANPNWPVDNRENRNFPKWHTISSNIFLF